MILRHQRSERSLRGGSDELVTALAESYLEWRECEMVVELAYEDWCASASAFAYRLYCLALDQEERAALIYAALVSEIAA